MQMETYITGYISTMGSEKCSTPGVRYYGNLIYADKIIQALSLMIFFADVYVDALRYIYVTGSASSTAGNNDYITIKYAGISSLPEKRQHALRIYPNRTTGVFNYW